MSSRSAALVITLESSLGTSLVHRTFTYRRLAPFPAYVRLPVTDSSNACRNATAGLMPGRRLTSFRIRVYFLGPELPGHVSFGLPGAGFVVPGGPVAGEWPQALPPYSSFAASALNRRSWLTCVGRAWLVFVTVMRLTCTVFCGATILYTE